MISDPEILATCDECGYEEYYNLTVTARGWDDRDLKAQMERNGWREIDGRDLCADCAMEHEEEQDNDHH
jgi:hypothetical protein